MREEFEQRKLDLVEEAKLKAHDLQLQMLWTNLFQGCPHRVAPLMGQDGIGKCSGNEMRSCILDVGREPCSVFGEIIQEWSEEYERENQANALRSS